MNREYFWLHFLFTKVYPYSNKSNTENKKKYFFHKTTLRDQSLELHLEPLQLDLVLLSLLVSVYSSVHNSHLLLSKQTRQILPLRYLVSLSYFHLPSYINSNHRANL